MAEKKQRKPRYTTPVLTAIWPYLNKPDDQPINGNPQRPAFKCRGRLPEDDDGKVLLNGKPTDETLKELLDRLVDEAWDAQIKETPPKYKKVAEKVYPYEDEFDDAGEPTGNIIYKFKQNAELTYNGKTQKVTIDLFDAKRNRIKTLIGNGSELKLAFTTRTFGMVQGKSYIIGITLDFSAAQVLKLVSLGGGGDAGSYGFGQEDGYEEEAGDFPEEEGDEPVEDDDEDDF